VVIDDINGWKLGNIINSDYAFDDSNNNYETKTSFTQNAISNNLNSTVYPNPANKDLFIELPSELITMATITIKDLNGKELITSKQSLLLGKNRMVIDVTRLKAGFYFVSIYANNKQSVLKITIQ
jgi:hypothetical protein